MKRILIASSAVAVLALSGLSAHASCSDPRESVGQAVPLFASPAWRRPHEGIVGTWRVTYPNNGVAFIQWHSDGTEWENITHPVLGGNICMGSWEALDRWHYSRNHFGWLFTNGTVSGYFNETETDVLAPDGNSYTGNNSTTLFNLDGSVMAGPFAGTASAVRIEP
jgi:hypothetical protein